MFMPILRTRVEKLDVVTALRIQGAQPVRLVPIAVRTGKTQVVRLRAAAGAQGNNVIDFKRSNAQLLRGKEIGAAVEITLSNRPAQFGGQSRTHHAEVVMSKSF